MSVQIYMITIATLQIYTSLAWLIWMILGFRCVNWVIVYFALSNAKCIVMTNSLIQWTHFGLKFTTISAAFRKFLITLSYHMPCLYLSCNKVEFSCISFFFLCVCVKVSYNSCARMIILFVMDLPLMKAFWNGDINRCMKGFSPLIRILEMILKSTLLRLINLKWETSLEIKSDKSMIERLKKSTWVDEGHTTSKVTLVEAFKTNWISISREK